MKSRPEKSPARGTPQGSKTAISPQSPFRRWLLRSVLLAVCPLFFLLALELLLRALGIGYATAFLLPSSIKGKAVLIQNDRFAWRFFGPDLAREPHPLVIPRIKPPGTIRIFVFGESAAYGDPQPEFGLPRMLDALLSGRFPGTRFEVINAAMTGINSHAILSIARDCAACEGDIWVVYMGNNEVVGPYGAGTVFGSQAASLATIRSSLASKTTRTGQWLDDLLNHRAQRPADQREWGGMLMFMRHQVRQDDPRMSTVYAHFQRNLGDLLRVGRGCGAKVVLSTVATNFKDCAPFASQHRPGLQRNELLHWDQLYHQGCEAQAAGQLTEAVSLLRQADQIDATFAELHFRWAQCALALGQDAEAKQHFILARDLDTLRFRTDSRINELIRQAAAQREPGNVCLADAEQVLERHSPHQLIGRELLYEHVHLNLEGNYLLARALAEATAQQLPQALTARPGTWPPIEDCARRLGWTDWHAYQAQADILSRLDDPPFATQCNHAEQANHLSRQLETLLPATKPPGLRQAEQKCREALAAAPDDWSLRQNLALLRQKSGDLAGAAQAWRELLDDLPHYTTGWLELGQVLAQQAQDESGAQAFRQALRLDPASVQAQIGLAQLLARQGQYEAACRLYQEILRRKPYWGPAHLGLGKTLQVMGKPEAAEPHFRQALQARIHTPAGLRSLGELCFEKGWLNEAATNFTDSLRLDPLDAQTQVMLGLTLGMLGRRAEARDRYAEAVRLDPSHAEARVRLGVELGREGNDAAALEQFAEAVRLQPAFLLARQNLAVALLHQHREDEAAAQFKEVLRQDPTNAAALKQLPRIAR